MLIGSCCSHAQYKICQIVNNSAAQSAAQNESEGVKQKTRVVIMKMMKWHLRQELIVKETES